MSDLSLGSAARFACRGIDYHKELNDEQREVVFSGDGYCLVLAGAGSGKTRTVIYRVAYLLEQGIDPSSILLLTFTNKAAREMLDRVAILLGSEAEGICGGTFHSVANRFLRRSAAWCGYLNGFTILDQEDARALLKAVLKDAGIDVKARRFPSPAVLQDLISYTRNTASSLYETLTYKYSNFEPLSGEIESIANLYAERKRAANAMDFDDLLINWLQLVEDATLGEAISARFKYILVDEYQDTNALQSRLVTALARVNQNLLVVGDDAQSIYAFRGADIQNILNFTKGKPDAKIFKLLSNYRSVPEILEVANDTLSFNTEQFEKRLVGMRDNGCKPILAPAPSARQEARFIVERILELRAAGTPLPAMAVLFRSSAHSQALEFELLKRDIPYEYRGGMKFFGRAHIKDVLAYLRVINNPKDEAAWLRILSLRQGIGAVTAMDVARKARGLPDLAKMFEPEFEAALPLRAREGWENFAGILRQAVERKGPAEMIRAVLDGKYQEHLEREYPDWKDRFEDLEQLAAFAEGYSDCESFLADISLYDDVFAAADGGNAHKERLILSTVHQAKGLEWDAVFVMNLADNAFPSRYAYEEENGLEEERRLFYVAITRARNRLFFTYPLSSGFDSLSINRLSTFVQEVSPHLLERLEVRDVSGTRVEEFADSDMGRYEDVIDLDKYGERRSSFARRNSSYFEPTAGATIFHQTKKPKPAIKKSFLRNIEDL